MHWLLQLLIPYCYYGYRRSANREGPGRWYQFNNELELPQEKSEKPKDEKPQMVFISEPLPEKPGMEPEQEA